MKLSIGFLIIFCFYLLAEGICALLPFSFPAAVLGIILLFLALKFKIVKLEYVESAANISLKYMALFFTPILVLVIGHYDSIKESLPSIILTLVFSTVLLIIILSLLKRGKNKNV